MPLLRDTDFSVVGAVHRQFEIMALPAPYFAATQAVAIPFPIIRSGKLRYGRRRPKAAIRP